MIACRSLLRGDPARSLTNAYGISNPARFLQRCYYYQGLNHIMKMGGAKGNRNVPDRKKQKAVATVWRPVSTQSRALDGDGEKSEVTELKYNICSLVSNTQPARGEAQVMNEPVDPKSAPTTLHNDEKGRVAQVVQVPSTEKHSITVQAGSSLIRFIKGKDGSTQKRIEEEMGVKIIFPLSKEDEFIIIEGISADNVARAAERIQYIIDEAVNSPNLNYSHFISLPLAVHAALVQKLENFQNSILGAKSPESELGIDSSVFIKPKTFHLTVLMLKLWNKERIHAASQILQSVSTEVLDALDGRPLSIKLKGVECMRGSLAEARVLYATVEEVGGEDRLLQACKIIIDAFVKGGLVLEKDANRTLKLHATLMNAKPRKRGKRTKVDKFDARGIVKQYGSEEWGEYLICEAHLSQRFVFDEKGYYRCCASIPFPENMQLD